MALTDCCFGKAFQRYPEKVRETDGWGWVEIEMAEAE